MALGAVNAYGVRLLYCANERLCISFSLINSPYNCEIFECSCERTRYYSLPGSSNVYVCVCVPRASSLKRRFRPYRGTCTLVLPEGGGPFVRTGRQRARQSGSARTSRVIWNSQKPTLLVSVGQKSTVSVGQRCQRLRVVDLVARVATCQPQRLVDLVAVNERRPALCTAHRCEGNQHPGV